MTIDEESLKRLLDSTFYTYEYLKPYRVYNGWGKTFYLDFCILSDKDDPEKKTIRLQKRFFGISKNMQTKGESEPRWVVCESFNINPKQDFPYLYDIIQKFKEGKLKEIQDVVQNIEFGIQNQRINQITKELRVSENKKRKSKDDIDKVSLLQNEVDNLYVQVNKLNDKYRNLKLHNYKANIQKYRKVIKELKSGLDSHASDEPYFQNELTQNKWIFGPWYEDVIPKRKPDISNEPDFVLKRFDGFADVVEIETPEKQLFTRPDKSDKCQPRSELIQALTQIINYVDSYNDTFKDELYKDYIKGIENPLNPYRPRGLLIIGRDKKSERMRLRQFNSFLNHVNIITYDELFQNAEGIINLIEKQRLK